MSADAAHGRIEKQMRQKQKVYDFIDFKECVKCAKCEVIEMQLTDFQDWESGTTQYTLQKLGDKRPYLGEICKARFVKGSKQLHFHLKWNEDELHVDFLATKFSLRAGDPKSEPRGISTTKKDAIMKDIVDKLLPENRRSFWEGIHTNDNRDDLRLSVSREENKSVKKNKKKMHSI